MLAEPRAGVVELNRFAVSGTVAASSVWNIGQTALYYSITGEPISTAIYGAYQIVSGAPMALGAVRAQAEGIALLRNKKELEQIAKENSNVRSIRVFSASRSQPTSLVSMRLHSTSLFFVEVEGNEIPKRICRRQVD
jgi:hypothetical protein